MNAKVKFVGPIDRVTGSCTLVRIGRPSGDIDVLVDCGIVQGELGAADWNSGKLFPFDPKRISAVFLTHAHVNHCGLVPLLVRNGFRGTVYCTVETEELARAVLHDCVNLGAAYSHEDVDGIRFHEPSGDAAHDGFAPVGDDLFLSWVRSGHVFGAVSLTLHIGPPRSAAQRSITFSGDIGDVEDGREHLTLNRFRENPHAAHFAVVESTYGSRNRPAEASDCDARLARLEDELLRAAAGAVLVIPAFAMDRTQQLLLDLHEALRRDAAGPRSLKNVSVLLHAKLAIKMNAIYARAAARKFVTRTGKVRPWWLGKDLFTLLELDAHNAEHERAVEAYVRQCLGQVPLDGDDACLARRVPGARPRLARAIGGPAELAPGTVLVTGGGMCDGGTVQAYLDKYLHRTDVTVAFTGYLSGGTVGARLARIAELPPEERARLPDKIHLDVGGNQSVEYPLARVRARFVQLHGYSGHADQAGLVRWVFADMDRSKPPVAPHLFVQHGNAHARVALAEALRAEAARRGAPLAVELPDAGGWFDLSAGCWDADDRSRRDTEQEIAQLEARLAELRAIQAA